ncbi:aminodeoxychorismate lyase [Vibrio astriarenae]|uniref:Aminodeoxychorismate lyase n=1 Tax=Vibrio astriarenae TaxID=1481923 RepID=A0A7Z2T1Z1_9VIBR|nr:aminodeoxychorismate lyase [Vibrio astriarenae]QIA62878.1 aminodeoxychorismate lyase [Vibrio astriarenae]
MFWVNGVPCDSISASDRSFQYGDGVFTTMLLQDGKVLHWSLHTQRLREGLNRLAIPHPNWSDVERWVANAAIEHSRSGIKVHISRGSGGRGYSPLGCESPVVTISAFQYPKHYSTWHQAGLELGICQTQLGLNPTLAGIKHNNRLEQIMAKAEMDAVGLPDGIVTDLNEHIVETTMANLFWRKGQTLYTPKMVNAGVKGITRNYVAAQLPSLGFSLTEEDFFIEDLLCADEVFVTNAILGVAPVSKIAHHSFSFSDLAKQLRKSYMSC